MTFISRNANWCCVLSAAEWRRANRLIQYRVLSTQYWKRSAATLYLSAAALLFGCPPDPAEIKPESTATTVQVVKPTLQTIDCSVQQPGFVNAYEQTSLFSKVSGFIKSFNVDIGQDVQKGQVLAEIFVPELNEQHQQMVEQVKLDEEMVAQARQLVEVAESNVENAKAANERGSSERGKI